MKKISTLSRLIAVVLTVCMVFGMMPMMTFASETASTGNTAIPYADAADGDLLYQVNFNFDANFTSTNQGTSVGTYTVSGENGEKVSVSGKSASAAFYGGKMFNYKVPGNVYTISYYMENSDWSSVRSGAWFYYQDHYLGLANDTSAEGQMSLLRGNTIYDKFDNSFEIKTDAEQNNRRYFKAVVDGTQGIIMFYALSSADRYELLGSVSMNLLLRLHSNTYYLRIGMWTGADAISAEQEVSMGDVQIRKGNTAVEKSAYQSAYDAASDGDVLYDADFNDIMNNTNDWDAFIGNNVTGTASVGEDGALTLTKDGTAAGQYVTAALPDFTAAHYGPMTYEFYLESTAPVGTWFMGNAMAGQNYRMGFSLFNTDAPESLFFVNDGFYDFDGFYNSANINRSYYRDVIVVESRLGSDLNLVQTPDTRADDPNIQCNVKVEFDVVNKRMTTYILKDGEFKVSASLYYNQSTFYPVFGIYQYDADTVTVVDNFVVKKGLTSGVPEKGVKFDYLLIHDNDGKDAVHPAGNYYDTDASFDSLPSTIEVWLNLSKYGYGEQSYVFDYASASTFRLTIDDGIPTLYNGASYTFSNAKISSNRWTHLAITCGAGDNGNEIRCYINGELVQTITAAAKVEPVTGIGEIPAELWLGGYRNEMNRYPFGGRLGDLAVYSDVRTAEEIKADMTAADIEDDAMLAYYKMFNSVYGEDIVDVSGNDNDVPFGKTWLTEEEMEEKRAQDPVEYVGSIAILPDTQYCLDRSPASFPPIFDYLVENVDARKIEHILHVGDITDRSSAGEWTTVKQNYDRLNGLVGYSFTQGNHDRYTAMNNYFGDKNGYYYQYLKENGGLFEEDSIVNNYVLFTVGNVDYIVLNIAYERGEAVFRWMSEVLNTYSDRKAIIVSHSTLSADSTMTSDGGKQMWAHAKKHPNVIMILGGHTTGDSLTNRWDVGDYGNAVYQSRIDAQHSDLYFDGLGMIAFFNFSEDGEHISVEYYSTRTGKYYHEQSQFTFSYDCYDSPLDGDHLCDSCEKSLTVCADADKDHVCDNDTTCAAYTSGEFAHADSNADHFCEYCGKGVKGDLCTDAAGDGNHACDICGADEITACADASADGNHTCDECNAVVTECSDASADGDHKCDECGAENLTVCADSDDADHYCDDCGKGVKGANCTDASGDRNHKCDICGADGITKCSDPVNDGDHKCDECGEIFQYVVDYSSKTSGKITGYPGGLRIDGFVEKVRHNSVAFKNSTVLPIENQKYEVSWYVEDFSDSSLAMSVVYGTYGSNTARHGWRTGTALNTMAFYYNDKDIAVITTPVRDLIDGRQYFKATVDAVTKTVNLYVLSEGEYKLADSRTFSAISYLQFGIHNNIVVVQGESMAVYDLTVTPLCSDADGDGTCDECGATHECADANGDYLCDDCGEEVACVDADGDNKCDICGTAVSYLIVTSTEGEAVTLKDLKGGSATSIPMGNGTITYDADTETVVFNNVTASAVKFCMNGGFTLNVQGTNTVSNTTTIGIHVSSGSITVTGTGTLNVTGATPAFHVTGGGYYLQTGATVKLTSKANHGLVVTGADVVIRGGTLSAYATGKYGITAQNGGKIRIYGGTVTSSATEQPMLVNKTSASITIEGGTVEVTSRSSGRNCIYGHGGVYIKGGNVTVNARSGYAIVTSSAAYRIEISGGTVNLKGSASIGLYGVSVISGGTITSDAGRFAYITSGKYLTISGGTVTGSGSYFAGIVAGATVNIDANANIDFTCTTQPFQDSDGAYTLTLNTDGANWEEGKELKDVAEACQIKTLNKADYTAVDEAIANANALNRDLYKDFTAVDTAISAVVTGKYATEQAEVDAMAKAINDAIAALEYKDADYTAVNEAIAVAKGLNKLHYKDFSAVDSAVAAVVTGLDITHQAEVDAMAEAIDEAISILEKYDNIITVITTAGEELVLGMNDDDKNNTLTVGSGEITYDTESAVVTLNNVTAQQIQFEMSRDFTLNVVGENVINNGTASSDISAIIVRTGNITVTGSGSLDLDAYSYAIDVQSGSYTQTGADIDIYVKYRRGIQTSGSLNVDGGTLKINAADRHHLYSNGGINISGGRVETTGQTNQIMAYGTGFKMTDGTLIVKGSNDVLRIYAGTCSIEGGTVEITGSSNLLISQEGFSVNISGGTVILTASTGNCINSGANITISQASETVPTVVTLNAAAQALRLNKSNRTCSILGGTVTGSGTHFVFTNTKSTVNVGTDAVIDFNCTTKPFTDADNSYTVILNTNGVIWEVGKELTDASEPTHIKTKVAADPTTVDLAANVKLTDKTLKADDFEFVLMDGETVLQTVKNDADGIITFAPIEYTEAGVYTYVVKQIKGEIAGITYDETVYTVTVTVVNENGQLVATVDTAPTFKNTYRVPFAEGKIENGKYIVTETGKATEMGLVKIGNDYYYVGPNGVLITGKYYAWRLNENCDIEKGWYCFGADGKMLQGICEHPDKDGLYYFENGKPTEKGLFLYDGDYYVAQYDGKIITGKYYVWKIDESAKEAYTTGWYEFDENGVIVPLKNGIVDGKYYVDGKPTEMGLFEYEGDLYVAQYDGTIITGKYYVWKVQEGLEDLNGAWRYFGKDGKLLQGIVDGYYYVNGVRTEMGLFLNDDGHYYVAQYDGKIITSENYTKYGAGKYYVWKTTDCDELKGWRTFGADGKMTE